MTGIKVFGHPASIYTRKVLIALYEKDLDFELVHVDIKGGEHKKEPHLSRNPFGKLPAFEDGDLKIFESRAITQYLAHRYADQGTNLIPEDRTNFVHYATMANGMEVEAHQFDPVGSKLVYEQVYKVMNGLTTDEAVVAEEEAKLAKILDIYEARLNASKYMAGDTYTLADLHHVPVIQFLLEAPTKKLFTERPRVNEWVSEITNRPASQKVLQ